MLDVVSILVIGGTCFVLSAMTLLPNLEMGQSEARLAQTWQDIQAIQKGITTQGTDLPETDPWSQPYQIEYVEDGSVRVLSSGPNRRSPADGTDEDDIHSDLKASPSHQIAQAKQRQLLMAFLVPVVAWVIAGRLYIRSRSNHSLGSRRSSD